jgi:Amt family ammonium transporter
MRCIATGLFTSPGLVANAYGTENYGWFYNWGMGNGTGKLLAVEIVGVLFIIGWVGLIMIPYFMLLNAMGLFRVDALEEEVGLDISHHKGAAYDLSGPSEDVKEKYEISNSQRKKEIVLPAEGEENA